MTGLVGSPAQVPSPEVPLVFQGVLFDLDGTLLAIDIDEFLGRYFAALGEAVAHIAPDPAAHALAMQAVQDAVGAMVRPHPDRTNREVFFEEFARVAGFDLDTHWEVFERFYDEVFPTLRAGLGPATGAREAFDAARACGLKVAIATNPIFPLRAIEHRLAWAGISPAEVDAITSYENMHACKPLPAYFRETAAMLDLDPSECIMVGDDPTLDLSAADVGMRTFFVGKDAQAVADYKGTMVDVAALIERSCE